MPCAVLLVTVYINLYDDRLYTCGGRVRSHFHSRSYGNHDQFPAPDQNHACHVNPDAAHTPVPARPLSERYPDSLRDTA